MKWFAIGLLLLVSAEAMAGELKVSGKLLISGHAISIFDIATKQWKVQSLENMDNNIQAGGLSQIDNCRILASFLDLDTEESWIYEIDLKSWRATKLVRGTYPVALRGQNKFLFISEMDKDSRKFLCVADVSVNPVSVTKVFELSVTALNETYLPIQVSKDKAVVAGPKGHEHEAYEIDLNTLEYKPSPIGKCIPRAWFGSRKRLLCWKGNIKYKNYIFFTVQESENPYILTSLDGQHQSLWNDEYINMDGTSYEIPIFYAPGIDVLFVRKNRTSIGYGGSLYAYDMKKHKKKWLFDGVIGPSDIIWVEELKRGKQQVTDNPE